MIAPADNLWLHTQWRVRIEQATYEVHRGPRTRSQSGFLPRSPLFSCCLARARTRTGNGRTASFGAVPFPRVVVISRTSSNVLPGSRQGLFHSSKVYLAECFARPTELPTYGSPLLCLAPQIFQHHRKLRGAGVRPSMFRLVWACFQ